MAQLGYIISYAIMILRSLFLHGAKNYAVTAKLDSCVVMGYPILSLDQSQLLAPKMAEWGMYEGILLPMQNAPDAAPCPKVVVVLNTKSSKSSSIGQNRTQSPHTILSSSRSGNLLRLRLCVL